MIIIPVLVRAVFLSPTLARTDPLHSIKAEEENLVPPTLRAAPCTSTVPLISFNTLWTGDADLRLYITTVQDG